ACNELTISSLDPASRTPEYKYCAAKVEKIDDQAWAEGEVRRAYDILRAQMGIEREAKAL
ncbi:MAG: hypothetical protein LBE49_05985, partial [Deltaproteobacteria bacterium]|nr:hypothetical protein [Deltaproteobacteria bacterium]